MGLDKDAIYNITKIIDCGNVAEVKREGENLIIVSKLPEKRIVMYRRRVQTEQ